jgi:chromosome segregation ATPase
MMVTNICFIFLFICFIATEHDAMIKKAERTERLIREIQTAKMELAQIRARHPEPRLTIDQASQFADEQMEQYLAISEKRDDMVEQAAHANERADKAETKTRLLRDEVMKKEKEAERIKGEAEAAGDATVAPEWYAQFLAFSAFFLPLALPFNL